jgi:1-acyl-sn-glycerol-3-phosphate acyltransferase
VDDDSKLTREAPPVYRFLAVLCSFLFTPFVRIRAERTDVARNTTTGIVIANHRSYFDAIMALIAFHRLRRYPRVVVAQEYFDMRFIGWMLRSAGSIPLDRDNPKTFDVAAHRVLDAGIPILVLPEGKLSGTPGDPTSLGQFKPGAARIAAALDEPVWALAHVGCDEVWPPGKRFPRLNPFRRKRVLLLGATDLVWMNGDTDADTERLRDLVGKLLEENVARRQESA